MPVYSIMLPDEILLKAIKGFKRIAILGCGGCANECLSYDKKIPLKLISDEHAGHEVLSPDAFISEANRLTSLFKNEVEDIRIAVGMGLCSTIAEDEPDEWIKTCSQAEAVVALCCSGGSVGTSKRLGKSIKVISGMKTVGVFYSYKVVDPISKMVTIDSDKSAVMRIFKRNHNNSDVNL